MKYTAIFIFILSCFALPAKAQKAQKSTNGLEAVDDVFKKLVDSGILSYKKPNNYKQLDTLKLNYSCGDARPFMNLINTLVNADSSVIIHICCFYTPNISKEGEMNDESVEFEKIVNHIATNQNFTPFLYPKEYSITKFNADYSGMYARKCSSTVEPRFTNNKIIFMGKGGYRFHLYYIYSNEFVEKIDEEIRKTIGFLKFKN